jgi:CRISPR-associated protein Cmr6
MTVPLYRAAGGVWDERSRQHAANLGLVFDKYFTGWKPDFTAYASDGIKHVWLKDEIARKGRGASQQSLKEAADRQRKLIKAMGGKTWPVTATSRFVTGTGIANPLENGFAFHHTLGVPYLPASGLKGALRAYWEQWHQVEGCDWDDLTERLFGKRGAGSVIFLDMLPMKPPMLVPEVMTPHYDKWYAASGAAIAENAPGDWMSPNPIPFLAVEAGAIFQIAVAPRTPGDRAWTEHLKHLNAILGDALSFVGLGAKTAVGYGRFEIDDGNTVTAAPSPSAKGRQGARQAAPAYQADQTLRAGTRPSWTDVGDVALRADVVLRPGIRLPIRLVDDGEEDEAPIGQIKELRHIK